jgi:hypothetical protein
MRSSHFILESVHFECCVVDRVICIVFLEEMEGKEKGLRYLRVRASPSKTKRNRVLLNSLSVTHHSVSSDVLGLSLHMLL